MFHSSKRAIEVGSSVTNPSLTTSFYAPMAELADALDSKSSARKSVWVRAPLGAPKRRLVVCHALANDLENQDKGQQKNVTELTTLTNSRSFYEGRKSDKT